MSKIMSTGTWNRKIRRLVFEYLQKLVNEKKKKKKIIPTRHHCSTDSIYMAEYLKC